MKPASIKKFDILYLGSFAIGLVGSALMFQSALEQTNADLIAAGNPPVSGGTLMVMMASGLVVGLILWFLVSRKRIEFVKWLIALIVGASVVSMIISVTNNGISLAGIHGFITLPMQIAAVFFLFQPETTEWFAAKHSENYDID